MATIIGGTGNAEALEISSTSHATKGGVQVKSDDFLEIAATTSNSAGLVKQNGAPFIHSYGTSNLFAGKDAGNQTLTTAIENLGVGADALKSLTTGDNNVAVGQSALQGLTTGASNIAIGQDALYSNVGRSLITAIGRQAGQLKTLGGQDVFVGYRSGRNVDGSNNVMIGNEAGITAGAVSGCVYIGYKAQPTVPASNQLAIHNAAGTPLIGGDFSSGFVRIDDELRLNTIQADTGTDDTDFVRKHVEHISLGAGPLGWTTFLTIAPSAVAGVYARGLIKVRLCSSTMHGGPVYMTGVREEYHYFEINNAAPTTGVFVGAVTSGSACLFQLNINGNNVELQVDADDTMSPTEIFAEVEIMAPEDYATGLTYTIS